MRTGSRSLRRLGRFLAPVLDVVLPLRARSARTKVRAVSDLPLAPEIHRFSKTEITTLLPYRHTAVQDAIRALKYEDSYDAARLLAQALADYLQEEIGNMRAFSPRPILLLPVPLHKDRLHERGFNQIERILLELPQPFQNGALAHVELHALTRTRATPQQTRLSRTERLRNVRGAFQADSSLLQHTRAIIIDDVTTTGATLGACIKALQKSGAEVTALAIARA